MLHKEDIDRLLHVEDRYMAADALGNILYGSSSGPRWVEFRQAFVEAVEDSQVSKWLPHGPGNLSPRAVGNLLGAVWYERRNS